MGRGKRKPYHDKFTIFKKYGYYYVTYRTDPSRPKSTHVPIEEGEEVAVDWAYRNLDSIKTNSGVTLGEFARDFFDPEKCTWTRRKITKANKNDRDPFGAAYLPSNRGRLKNYILPRFEHVPLHLITTKMIDEWLMDLDSVQSGLPPSTSSQDKILNALRIIMREARYQGYLADNPAARVESFDSFVGHKREPFTMEEIRRLFPLELNRALKIWQGMEWYVYFLLEWTCGLRPQEAGGFMLKDWIKDYHGAIISRRVENFTRSIKEGLKTSNRGMTVKPVVFTDHLENILGILEEDHPRDELLVQSTNGGPIIIESANKHFKLSAKRAGVDLKGRTQYSLRHSYYTELLKKIPESDVEKMAGHKALRKEYDHRKGIDFLKAAQPLREVINQISA